MHSQKVSVFSKLAGCLSLILMCAALPAQEIPPSPAPPRLRLELQLNAGTLDESADLWTLHRRVSEVTLFFTATEHHRFVHDLSAENVRIVDDNRPVPKFSAFQHQLDLPLRIGLLIDTSGSVNPRFRFEQESAIQFLRQVVRKDLDLAFVMGFSDHIHLSQDYSDDTARLAAGVLGLRNGGGTALFDTIRQASRKLADASTDEKPVACLLIVLSDGQDNASSISFRQALDLAARGEITIYTINTRTDSVEPRMSNATAEGDAIMKRLAEQTGGRFFSRMSSTGVAKAFAAIEEEIRNRFVLSYPLPGFVEDDRFRRIEIKAEKSGHSYRVHARKGYYTRLASLRD